MSDMKDMKDVYWIPGVGYCKAKLVTKDYDGEKHMTTEYSPFKFSSPKQYLDYHREKFKL